MLVSVQWVRNGGTLVAVRLGRLDCPVAGGRSRQRWFVVKDVLPEREDEQTKLQILVIELKAELRHGESEESA